MKRYVVVNCCGDIFIVEADTIAEVCEKVDWKYPGSIISVTLLPEDID